MFNTILFPIDYRHSQEAIQAVETVIAVVKKYQARLILLSVVDEDHESDRDAINQMQEKAKATLSDAGINAETHIAEGKPAFVICDVADEMNADLIVMGSRGISLTEEHPEGSVSQRVISLSPCPVLVVP